MPKYVRVKHAKYGEKLVPESQLSSLSARWEPVADPKPKGRIPRTEAPTETAPTAASGPSEED